MCRAVDILHYELNYRSKPFHVLEIFLLKSPSILTMLEGRLAVKCLAESQISLWRIFMSGIQEGLSGLRLALVGVAMFVI